MRTRVFLSYAREDVAAARKLHKDLNSLGVEVWFDEKSLLPGQNWRSEIRHAIRSSDFFILVLSQSSVTKRGLVQHELKDALDVMLEMPEGKVFIIPARIEPVEPNHELLRNIQWVDLFDNWSEGIRLIGLTLYGKDKSLAQDMQKVDLPQIITSAIETTKLSYPEVTIKVSPNLDEAAQIHANPHFVEVVIKEILTNAIRHTLANMGGPFLIQVEVHSTSNSVILEIKNPIKNLNDMLVTERGPTGKAFGLQLARNAALHQGGDLQFSIQNQSQDSETGYFVVSVSFSRWATATIRNEEYVVEGSDSTNEPWPERLSTKGRDLLGDPAKFPTVDRSNNPKLKLRFVVFIVSSFVLVVFILFFWIQWEGRETNGPELDFSLYPNMTRGDGVRSTIRLIPNIRFLRLHLTVLDDRYQSYQATLLTEAQERILSVEELNATAQDGSKVVTVRVSTQGLASGDYHIPLIGITYDGKTQEIATYYFRVVN